MYGAFLVAALALAGAQTWALRETLPSPDTVEYFEVADQIVAVGYQRAMSLHWSPLYPLYLAAAAGALGRGLERELTVSVVGYAALLLLACTIVAFVVRSLGRSLWPDRDQSARLSWTACGLGITLYLCFSLFKVSLRLPDVLVLCFVTLALWSWCKGFQAGLGARWAFCAGIFGGLGFLSRANLLHWSVTLGLIACAIAPKASIRRRAMALSAFFLGLLVFVGPQAYVLSLERGRFTFGESGKLVFAETYGAVWERGEAEWPVQLAGRDVRIFPEYRMVNFPGFYDPGREYDGARVPFRLSAAIRGMSRAAHSCLFGYYSPSFALLWPLVWMTWPLLLFAGDMLAGRRGKGGQDDFPERQRAAWLLVTGGAVGVAMHLMSFCIGYYLAPYVFAMVTGLMLLMLRRLEESELARYGHRSCYIVAAGCAVVTLLSTMAMYRSAHSRGVQQGIAGTHAVVSALQHVPAPGSGLRRVAVGGHSIGQYFVRLSRSQVFADLPDLSVFDDPARLARAIEVLRDHDVRVVLAPLSACADSPAMPWRAVRGSGWCLLELGRGSGGVGSRI